jgi:hypothetical protein
MLEPRKNDNLDHAGQDSQKLTLDRGASMAMAVIFVDAGGRCVLELR